MKGMRLCCPKLRRSEISVAPGFKPVAPGFNPGFRNSQDFSGARIKDGYLQYPLPAAESRVPAN